ncbi:MAG: DUF1579 family protein [Planctomycetes bacterium]|nr:DUF1579 family protein [Planctomycetota bacterium]
MFSNRFAACVLVLGVLALASTAAVQDKKGEGQKPLAPQFAADGMQRWMEVNKTDHRHAKLAEWIGTWDTEMRMWMGGPGSQPTVTKGTATFSWIVEGRWLKQEAESEMDMGSMKLKVRSFGQLGFDRYKQKYVGSNIDSMTTTLLTYEGNFDFGDKNLILWGTMDEPMSGEHDKMVKYVWRFPAPDKMVYEVHDTSIGEENTKVVEFTYTRRK